MCLSFESSFLFEHSVLLRQEICSRSCCRFDPGPRLSFVVAVSGHFEIIATSAASKLEQDLAAAIRLQGLLERFLELVERVHMLHCGGERSVSN